MKRLVIILLLATTIIVAYFWYKNTHINNGFVSTSNEVSSVIVPNVIDKWDTKVTWDKPTSGNYQVGWMEKPATGIIRKGTILGSDQNPYDLVSKINSIIVDMGWQAQLPVGASGPMERITTYFVYKDGSDKQLIIVEKMVDDITKSLPKYKSEILIFQEQ